MLVLGDLKGDFESRPDGKKKKQCLKQIVLLGSYHLRVHYKLKVFSSSSTLLFQKESECAAVFFLFAF